MKNFLSSRIFKLIWSVLLAFLIYWICPPCFSKTTLLILLAVQLLLINASFIIGRWAIITHISRFLTGGLFIFSGFIKANDTVGFSYKLEEYFEVFKADTGLGFFEWFAHISLPLAIIICASEIVLGVFLLLGFKKNLTLWLLFAQIAFFTFLTFYSACFNKVTHCGCFGDFLQLKPWESFWKDVALMILITLLFAGRDNIPELMAPMPLATFATIGLIASVWFPIYTLRNLPVFDFRPYKIGNNIKEQMKPGPNYKEAEYSTTMVYKNLKDGSKKEMLMDEYMKSKIWEDTLVWKYDTMITKLVHEAIDAPKITDFNVSSIEGDNITDSILNYKGYAYWLITYDLGKAKSSEKLHAMMNDFYQLAQKDKVPFIAFTASGPKEIDEYKHKYNALYDFVMVDATVLKTMIRSNPGLMLLKDGAIIMMWHHNNFPSYSEAKQKYFK